jgi:hypothetical protein
MGCDIQKAESALVVVKQSCLCSIHDEGCDGRAVTWAASMTWEFVEDSSRKASNLGLEPPVTVVKTCDTKYDNF